MTPESFPHGLDYSLICVFFQHHCLKSLLHPNNNSYLHTLIFASYAADCYTVWILISIVYLLIRLKYAWIGSSMDSGNCLEIFLFTGKLSPFSSSGQLCTVAVISEYNIDSLFNLFFRFFSNIWPRMWYKCPTFYLLKIVYFKIKLPYNKTTWKFYRNIFFFLSEANWFEFQYSFKIQCV